MKRKITALLICSLVAGLTACGGGGKTESVAEDSSRVTVEEESPSAQNETEKDLHWYDLTDWSKYKLTDTPLSFGESSLEAPLTWDNMKPYITDWDIARLDQDSASLEDLFVSDTIPQSVKPEPLSDTIVLDGIELRMGFLDYAKEAPFKELYASNQFGMYADDHVMKAFGLGGLKKPEDAVAQQYKIEALCEKYGRPSIAVIHEIGDYAMDIFWDRDSYVFGFRIADASIYNKETYDFKIDSFNYYTKPAWENYIANDDSITVMPFDELISK